MNSMLKVNSSDFNKTLMEMLCKTSEDSNKYCLISNVKLKIVRK